MTTTTPPHAVTGLLHSRPGRAGELVELLSPVVGRARSEPGCLHFHLHRSVEDPDLVVLYEVWQTAEDLRRHLDQPAMAAVNDALAGLLSRDPQVYVLDLLSPEPAGSRAAAPAV